MGYSLVLSLVGVAGVTLSGFGAVFAVAAICWVQNVVLPWWYTQGWVGVEAAGALILLKEVVLLALFVYVAWSLPGFGVRALPAPIKLLLGYALYLIGRVMVGVLFLGEALTPELRLVRSMLLPVEATLVGFVGAVLVPKLENRYVQFAVYGLLACALVSLVLYFCAPPDFWLRHVNIALYNVNVKGDPAWTVLMDRGVSGSGAGRAAFSWLSSLRLFGTFGDPLTAGFALSVGLVLLTARTRIGTWGVAAAAVLAVTVFLTFSRSAWILAVTVFAYAGARLRRPARLGLLLVVGVGAWLTLGGFRDFLLTSLAVFETGRGDVYHAEGLRLLYSGAVLKPAYLLGTGPLDMSGQRPELENGLVFMMAQFGVVLMVLFAAVCVSAERYLRARGDRDALSLAAAGLAIATLIVSHFSFYALSFTAYFGIWSAIGLAIGAVHRRNIVSGGPQPDWGG